LDRTGPISIHDYPNETIAPSIHDYPNETIAPDDKTYVVNVRDH